MDIINEQVRRNINYNELRKNCYIRSWDQDTDINVIIPVRKRTEFNAAVSDHLFWAAQYSKKSVKVTFVEHADSPEHIEITSHRDNYIFLPAVGKRFNKCLAFNAGFVYSTPAKYYLLHDVDIMVPVDYFEKIFLNLPGFDALQTFTARRLIQCNESLTNKILAKVVSASNISLDRNPEIRHEKVGAAGGSIFVTRDLFLKVGGFDPEFFTEYSIEDQFFFDKLNLCGKLGFCDNPPIELFHLHHAPSFNRETKKEDWDAFDSYAALTPGEKMFYINQKSKLFTQFINPGNSVSEQ